MTAFCSGHTSSAKPEFGAFIYMAPAAVGALLNNIPTPWAVALAAYIGARTYDASTFCAGEPPEAPDDFTAADVINLLNVYNPVLNVPAATKFQQLVDAFAWHQFCQCDGVSTPAPPAPPDEPDGMPTIDSGPVSNTPCGTYVVDHASAESWSNGGSRNDIISAVFPAGATSLKLTFHSEVQSNSGWTIPVTLFFNNGPPSHAAIGPTAAVSVPPSGDTSVTLSVPPGTSFLNASWTGPGGTARITRVWWDIEYFCGATLGTGGECCTDPQLIAQVQTILNTVLLIQRQAVAFAYIDGESTDVSDSGELELSGAIGARIDLTTVPGRAGVEVGDPDTLFDIGWFRWGDATGWGPRQRIDADPLVSLPAQAGVYTRLGYTLTPGVEATVTVLVREP